MRIEYISHISLSMLLCLRVGTPSTSIGSAPAPRASDMPPSRPVMSPRASAGGVLLPVPGGCCPCQAGQSKVWVGAVGLGPESASALYSTHTHSHTQEDEMGFVTSVNFSRCFCGLWDNPFGVARDVASGRAGTMFAERILRGDILRLSEEFNRAEIRMRRCTEALEVGLG
jgi:hypothetical protein